MSLIQSNYRRSGSASGVAVGGAGFVLHNRGALFTLDDGHPNALAGRKRPLHTIIPAFMAAGDTRIAFGIMGGWNQAQAHAQFVSNMVDFRHEHPGRHGGRRALPRRLSPAATSASKQRVPEDVRERLTAMGHRPAGATATSPTAMGGGQAVMRDYASGMNYGASDPRKDGAAMAEWPAWR